MSALGPAGSPAISVAQALANSQRPDQPQTKADAAVSLSGSYSGPREEEQARTWRALSCNLDLRGSRRPFHSTRTAPRTGNVLFETYPRTRLGTRVVAGSRRPDARAQATVQPVH